MATPNEKLEAARMQKRWSVAVASERAEVSVNTFNRWERGLQVPQLGTLDRLCKAFGLSPEELGFGDSITLKRRAPPTPQEQQALENNDAPCQSAVLTTCSPADALPRGQMPLQPTHEALTCIEQIKRSLDSMSEQQNLKGDGKGGKGVSRRQVFSTLIGAPVAIFGLTQSASSALLHPEEVLALCAVHIPFSWQLYFEGGLAEVERILPGYLSQLLPLAQQSSPYSERAASLLSQGYQLASLLALQHQNFGTAYNYARQAFDYGELADNPALQATSLVRQAAVYLYLKHPIPRLQAYQRALELSANTSPLLQGRIYAGLTEVHSSLGHEYDAQRFLELAHTTFPESYETDPNFSYTHFNHWSITALEGLTCLNLNQPEQAWDAFAKIDQRIPTSPVPNRVELTVRQADTAVALSDRDQACTYIEAARNSALALGNQLRYDEVHKLYDTMLTKWPNEPSVKALQELVA